MAWRCAASHSLRVMSLLGSPHKPRLVVMVSVSVLWSALPSSSFGALLHLAPSALKSLITRDVVSVLHLKSQDRLAPISYDGPYVCCRHKPQII